VVSHNLTKMLGKVANYIKDNNNWKKMREYDGS